MIDFTRPCCNSPPARGLYDSTEYSPSGTSKRAVPPGGQLHGIDFAGFGQNPRALGPRGQIVIRSHLPKRQMGKVIIHNNNSLYSSAGGSRNGNGFHNWKGPRTPMFAGNGMPHRSGSLGPGASIQKEVGDRQDGGTPLGNRARLRKLLEESAADVVGGHEARFALTKPAVAARGECVVDVVPEWFRHHEKNREQGPRAGKAPRDSQGRRAFGVAAIAVDQDDRVRVVGLQTELL